MSQAVIHGSTVYLAGQVGSGESVEQQTRGALQALDDVLREAGSHKSRLLTVTIFLADISTFNEMNAVWDEWVDTDFPPARATVESKLALPEYLVEIVAIAAI